MRKYIQVDRKDMAKINFHFSDSQLTELKIVSILTKKTMSEFIRLAIQAQIKKVKEQKK